MNESDKEIWKTLLENEYDISNFGRVKSLARTYINISGQRMPLRERILKATLNRQGFVIT